MQTILNKNINNISVSYSSPNPTVTTTQGTGTITEFSHVNFNAMNVDDSITIAGLKYTATVFNSPQDVERSFSNLAPNTPSSSIPASNKVKGTFSGALSNFGTDINSINRSIVTNQSANSIEFSDSTGSNKKINIINSTSISIAQGEVSVIDGNLYLGSGHDYRLIAIIDTSYNGDNGILKFNYINNFNNSDFNNGTDGSGIISGWQTINSRIKLDGTSTLGGFPTVVDNTTANGGLEATSLSSGSYTVNIINDSGNGLSVKLTSNLSGVVNTSPGIGAVVHGPAILSNNSVYLSNGDKVKFDWKAQGGQDAYDIVAYLININNGTPEIMLNRTGSGSGTPGFSTDWQNNEYTVANSGEYKFVFISGTWDATHGMAAGASLYIDNVQINYINPINLNLSQINSIKTNLSFDLNNSNGLIFTSDSANINVNDISVTSEIASVDVSTVEGISSGPIDPNKKTSSAKFDFQVGPSPDQIISIEIPDFGKNGNITNDVTSDKSRTNVTTTMASMEVIEKINTSLDSVSTTRATMGAIMTRLQHVVDNLTNVSMNEEASRSQIEDADYASASTELARAQIMQQAATAVLAQANVDLNMVLKLLNG